MKKEERGCPAKEQVVSKLVRFTVAETFLQLQRDCKYGIESDVCGCCEVFIVVYSAYCRCISFCNALHIGVQNRTRRHVWRGAGGIWRIWGMW